MLPYLRFQDLNMFRPPTQCLPSKIPYWNFTVVRFAPSLYVSWRLTLHHLIALSVYVYIQSVSFLGALAKLWKMSISFIMSVSLSSCLPLSLSTWNKLAPTRKIFMEFDTGIFFWKFLEKIQVSIKSDKNKVYIVRRPMYRCVDILHNYSWNKKCLRKIFRNNHSFYLKFIGLCIILIVE